MRARQVSSVMRSAAHEPVAPEHGRVIIADFPIRPDLAPAVAIFQPEARWRLQVEALHMVVGMLARLDHHRNAHVADDIVAIADIAVI